MLITLLRSLINSQSLALPRQVLVRKLPVKRWETSSKHLIILFGPLYLYSIQLRKSTMRFGSSKMRKNQEDQSNI